MPFPTRLLGLSTSALLALAACSGGSAPETLSPETLDVRQDAPADPATEGAAARAKDKDKGGGTAAAPTDVFGVTMLYPSRPGGEAWSLSDTPGADPRFDPQQPITQNADGSWKLRGDKVRMLVLTSTGYHPEQLSTLDRDVLARQGYMQSPNDWRNVEVTGFVRLNHATDTADNFTWYARGGHHTDTAACEGSSYKGGLHYDGRARWEKESWHVAYVSTPYRTVTRPLQGRWVGFKAVIRNVEVDGRPAVKLESWVNDAADGVTWQKVYEWVDDGGWGGDSAHCGAADTAMPLTWGGPVATFRWDGADDVDFKWLSVREVE